MLFDAYDAGDEDAIAVLDDYAKWASSGILSLQSVLDVERYAIGGGISARPEATSLIREKVDWLFDQNANYPFSRPQIVTCTYGNEANLIGALAFHL
jgi:predicted NBD/HSP70 family sugar kinase